MKSGEVIIGNESHSCVVITLYWGGCPWPPGGLHVVFIVELVTCMCMCVGMLVAYFYAY